MNVTGIIHMRQRYDPVTEYTWNEIDKVEGGPYFQVSLELIEETKEYVIGASEFNIGPYRMKILEHEIQSYSVICVMKNKPLWKYYKFKYNFIQWLKLAYYRSLMTLQVWNLARRIPGTYPSWRDIRIFKA